MGAVERIGYVYFLVNSAMPGLVKIGQTQGSIFDRLNELQTTGVPIPFTLGALFLVNDSKACERAIHQALRMYRENGRREFFRISLGEAIGGSQQIVQRSAYGRPGPKLRGVTVGADRKASGLGDKKFTCIDSVKCVLSYLATSSRSRICRWELLEKGTMGRGSQDGLLAVEELLDARMIKASRQSGVVFYELTASGRRFAMEARLV
jgi:hypothetical protein